VGTIGAQGRMRHERRQARDVLVMAFTISAGVCARLNCSVISPFPRNAEGPTPGNVRIPTKPDTYSNLKPDAVPRRSRTAFRFEAGR
jgi:hypothetical protein